MIKHHDVDIAVIGGGPAGLAAAISAKKHGANNIVVIDRNSWLGGILPQCIHDGFGVEETGKSLTGPEYAEKYVEKAIQENIKLMNETMVLKIKQSTLTAVNKKGVHKIRYKSLILATGCREKTRWNAMIPGTRPSGIYTAGVAQALINLYNIMPGKKIVILGSGDVGLIMARRLKLEGADVIAVIEILPYPTGLPRNIVQCLQDYNIPLLLNHTVTSIEGKERLEKIIISQVDKEMTPIPGTEKEIKCDTLLLSLGLIPENELARNTGIQIDKTTGGPIVDQDLQTNINGIFACGNCLQVYDTVDLLSIDAKTAGKNAAEHIQQKNKNTIPSKNIKIIPGQGVKHVVPQIINKPGIINLTLRPQKPSNKTPTLLITINNKEIHKKRLRWTNPANIIRTQINIPQNLLDSTRKMEVTINEQQ